MGFPAGLPKTMIVDLSGKIPVGPDTRVRIVTSMRIYWDRIRVETARQDPRLTVTTLVPRSARTAWVGYPREWSPDGKAPFYYDFSQRDATAPWKLHAGRLHAAWATCGIFSAAWMTGTSSWLTERRSPPNSRQRSCPRCLKGWARDWLLYVDGFGKDMDLHSQYPDTVEPLPRHRDLPYRDASWCLPADTAWEAFRRSFLTRAGS